MRVRLVSSMFWCALTSGACVAERPAPPTPLTIRFPQAVSETHPRMAMIREFATKVEQRSGGRILVKSFPGGELYGARQAVQAAAVGDVEMALEPETHFITFNNAYRALDVPFQFATTEQFQSFVRQDFDPKVEPSLAKAGLKLVASWDEGPMVLATRTKIVRTPADFQGLKIRSSGHELLARTWNEMGATTLNIPIQEVYSALQQGVAEGIYTTFNTFVSGKTHEVAPKVVLWPSRSVYVWVVNKLVWDGLPEVDRGMLAQAARETTEGYDKLIWGNYEKLVATIRSAQGGEFYELTPEDIDVFRKRLKPLLTAWATEFAPVLASGH